MDEHGSYQNGNDDFLYINSACETQPLLQDKNFRLALNYAINHQEYITLATNDVYDPACTTFVLPLVGGTSKTYGEQYGDKLHAFPKNGDADKAKEYLKKAMDAAGITDPSSIVLNVTCTDNETEKKIVETIQYMWKETLGINVEIRQITYAEKYTVIFTNHDYEVGYGGWSPDYSDPYTYLELFNGGQPQQLLRTTTTLITHWNWPPSLRADPASAVWKCWLRLRTSFWRMALWFRCSIVHSTIC